MVRPRDFEADDWKEFYQMSDDLKQFFKHVRHPSYSERRAVFEDCKIHLQRGINLIDLRTTSIPDTVNQRGWTHFVQTPEPYDPTVVRDFYAAMRPPVYNKYHTVRVRGVPVKIGLAEIWKYLQIQPPHNIAFTDGFETRPILEDANGELAASLRRDGNYKWIPGKKIFTTKASTLTSLFGQLSSSTTSFPLTTSRFCPWMLQGAFIAYNRALL